jgi:hypothetical protein
MRRIKLFFRALKRKIKNRFDNYVKYEPVEKKQAIANTLYLLRRDFNLEEQNEVMLSLVKQLNDLRDADIKQKEMELAYMNEQTNLLRQKLILN